MCLSPPKPSITPPAPAPAPAATGADALKIGGQSASPLRNAGAVGRAALRIPE